MSLRSMTGFGRGEAAAGGIKVEIEISSINRKQLDVTLVLPKSLEALESRIQEEIHKGISRGRLRGEVFLTLSSDRRRRALRIDEDLAAAYLSALRRTAGRLKLEDDLGSSFLLTLPGVVQFNDGEGDAEAIWPLVSKALTRALQRLVEMKQAEGLSLQKDLEGRMKDLGMYVTRIRRQAPSVVRNYRRNLLKRLESAGLELDVKDERVLKELTFFADRSDIAEELTRLDSHLAQAAGMLHSTEPVGKSLDFLAQEMFREINTIGSKANDARVLRQVVSFKAELERVREQAANVE